MVETGGWGPQVVIQAAPFYKNGRNGKAGPFFLVGPKMGQEALKHQRLLICEVLGSGNTVATGENRGLEATGRHPSCCVFFWKMGGLENECLKRLTIEENMMITLKLDW